MKYAAFLRGINVGGKNIVKMAELKRLFKELSLQNVRTNGNCAEAIKTYEKALDAKTIQIQKYGDMLANPAFPISDSDKDLVLRAQLQLIPSWILNNSF